MDYGIIFTLDQEAGKRLYQPALRRLYVHGESPYQSRQGIKSSFLQFPDQPCLVPDLKLCAYVRMNLLSKEISQLMNISVRGVEIARYRLRKKLQLATDENLSDCL